MNLDMYVPTPPPRGGTDEAMFVSIESQLALLQESVSRLSTKAQSNADDRVDARVAATWKELMREKEKVVIRTELDVIPSGPVTVFCEFDGLCCAGSIEVTLLGSNVQEGRDAQQAAWQGLKMTLGETLAKLDAAGVRIEPAFIDFVEQCSIRRMRVCVLSRGLKPLIRAMLRDQGIGHVEVLAHDGYVDEAGEWHVSLRDDSRTGHDKAESLRRALRNHEQGAVVLVGRTACDFAPVLAGGVDCVLAPRPSALASLCDQNSVRTRTFEGWDELSKALLRGP
jgi:2-hydroxy-3-keto-5-methylthiopentenyl-1-phosphate phosphatase